MKDEESSDFTKSGQWLLTILPLGVYAAVYVWLEFYVASHSIRGNAFLSGLTFLGAFVVWWFLLFRLCNIHKLYSWPQLRSIPLWGFIVLLALGSWYLVAGILPNEEARLIMAYAPLVIPFLLLIRFMMLTKKQGGYYDR